MIQIAICYEQGADIRFLSQEIKTCYNLRNIMFSLHLLPLQSQSSLKKLNQIHPDVVLFFEHSLQDADYHFVKQLKKKQPKLILASIQSNAIPNTALFNENEFLYCSSFDRKSLWNIFHQIYDLYIDSDLFFTFFSRPQYVSTPLSDILYFWSEARRIHLISQYDEDQVFYSKLNDLEATLQNKKSTFVRIHHSLLVNLDYVKKYNREFLVLKNGETLKISNYKNYKQLDTALSSLKACMNESYNIVS